MKIATNSFAYAQIRNFVLSGSTFADYVRISDIFILVYWAYARFVPRRLRHGTVTKVVTNLYMTGGFERVRLRHLFNTLAFWSGPWVVTFESELPRWSSVSSPRGRLSRVGLRLIAAKSCRKIIAISRNAVDVQLYRMELDPALARCILPKITVLHPPQSTELRHWEDKGIDLDGRVRFALVGHAFFMKGGREALTVFDRLLRAGYPLELRVVSRLETDGWATCTKAEDVLWAKAVMARHPDAIYHHECLPNPEVMKLFRGSHVALLPSYAETYGYSILEAQAWGCPVISTDVGAMPEINNDRVGWVISVPKRDYGGGRTLGRSRYHTPEDRRDVSRTIEAGLQQAVLEIMEQRSLISQRGEAAIARIRSDHDPARHAERLKQIYTDALS